MGKKHDPWTVVRVDPENAAVLSKIKEGYKVKVSFAALVNAAIKLGLPELIQSENIKPE